jgi:transcriptional regulator with XRE-family HTH domain
VTFGADVRDRLRDAESLPVAIRILRIAAGSHDKLAAELGTSRQSIIAWEKGRFPEDYVAQLRDLGVPARLLTRVSRDEVEARLRAVEAEVAALRDLLGE